MLSKTMNRSIVSGLAWVLMAPLFFSSQAFGAPVSIAQAMATGSERSLTLQTSVQPDSDDVGKSISMFVIGLVPSDQGGRLFAKAPTGWIAVQGNSAPSLVAQTTAQTHHTLALAQGEDARGLAGTTIYVGYGLEGSGADSALSDMLRNQRYRLVYTFPSQPSSFDWALQPTTEASLAAYFREALGPTGKTYLTTPWATDMMVTTTGSPPGTATVSSATATVSGTTLQEAGVDEADWVKTDGGFVFGLARAASTDANSNLLQRQRFVTTATDAALAPVDTLKVALSADVVSTGVYLDADRKQVVVLGEGASRWGIYDAWFAPQAWAQGVTELALVDTTSPTQMQAKRKLRISGSLVGSRRLGSTLYLVLRSYPTIVGLDPYWPTEKTLANQALLDKLSVATLLPTLAIDGGTAQPVLDASACLTQPNNAFKSADIITIMAIDLASASHRHAARCFTGGTEAFYMSDQSLYLATTRSNYTYGGIFPVYAQQSSTDIHKFALNGLEMAYRGSGNVMGHLGFDQNRKSFRMGEHLGALRVISQSGTTWGGWLAAPVVGSVPVIESPGRLSILQEDNGSLQLTAELPNARRPAPLGKAGEQLYASRFIGARGFLVTYRLTDPLYVLDLSNPADPFIAGELQVSGYSDYLFPLSETLLLGVGKEAISDSGSGDGRFAWYQGVKLSLIDLTDPTRPVEAARSIIGRRGSDATVLHDHHGIALSSVGSTVRVSLPVSVHETAPAQASGAASDYFQFTRTELQKFEINLSQPALTPRSALPASTATQRDISRDRSILWNDQVHYYQDGVWRSGVW